MLLRSVCRSGMIEYFDAARINSGPFLFTWRHKEMDKAKKYTLNLTGNECDLIEFALHLASKVEETTGHKVIANRMDKLAREVYKIHNV